MKTLLLVFFISVTLFAQDSEFSIARLKYGGGSDWYNDPSAEVNLLNYVRKTTGTRVKAEYKPVDLASDEIFGYPFLFLTGHGNVVFSDDDAARLRKYLENGGFLYVDDDYGIDKAFRRELKKVFPDKELLELPFSHKLYHAPFEFPAGPPKTHEHDNKAPQGFGIFINQRLVLYYTYESNPSDGWADPEVHSDSPQIREEALKFGTNLVVYVISN